MKRLILAAAIAAPLAASAQAPSSPQIINLSCVEALVSIGQSNLAGVFSFISDKDGPAAFADLLTHNKDAFKKFVAKAQKDKKIANGISAWDRDSLVFALGIYDSPLGATLDQPGDRLKTDAQALIAGPVVTLEQISAARRKG